MHVIPNKVDFYITNVCNLTCDNCNRFNNYNFKGWQRWSDYESIYEHWGQLVELRAITIMGGEPMLNPSIKEWVQGLNRIFGIEVQILTNGTRFRQCSDLYSSLLWRSKRTGALNHIGVSLHNLKDWPEMESSIHDFLQGPVKVQTKEQNIWNADWHFADRNGVKINVYRVDEFGPSAIRPTDTGKLTLHNSDPVQAHDNCSFAKFKSYHFIKGKLYKCGPVALLPEFNEQFALHLSTDDLDLLNSYQPLTVDNYQDCYQKFFENLDDPIPQCKFCPTQWITKPIFPIRKGL